jgi:gliding motility-associated-like protein
LYVLDANGCATQTNFSIDSVFEHSGTLEGELLVDEGDATTLTFTFTPGIPDSVVWIVDGILFCANCDSIQLEPESTTEVMLIMYDENLCEIIIRATLIVRKNRDIFIPNVFSPNGDGINDFFTIYPGTEGTMVNSMRIFTRWGEVVYFDEEFNPLIESEGWDGTFAGKEMNPGVYVYYVEIEHPDGLIETLKGDITLIR